MMKVPQMLHQMISPCKSFFSNAIAAAHRAGEVRGRGAMYGGLVALQVSQACEVGGAGAGGEVACPCPGRRLKKRGGELNMGVELVLTSRALHSSNSLPNRSHSR